MKATHTKKKSSNSKGASLFKKMLEDKATVRRHLKTGGKLSDLKNKLPLVKTVSIKGA